MLPLHAAGIYDGPVVNRDAVSSYAVSSYTPTFTAFCRAVDHRSSRVNESTAPLKSALIIADQTDVGEYCGLPNVIVEADIIRQLFPPDRIMDPSDSALKSGVDFAATTALRIELLHFACHGRQDPSNPLLSGLELQTGRLTLDQLTKITFPNGRLAYLSACETASIDSGCPDSGMNLATTFLFNGFKSVIGSIWYLFSLDHT
jgi:CHAT domain-containing protein